MDVSTGQFEDRIARVREQLSSRRDFLADSAKVGGGAIAGALLVWAAASFVAGRVSTTVWWLSFAGGWLLVDRADLSTERRYDLVAAAALLGALLVAVGAWMEWTVHNPLYDGPGILRAVPPSVEMERGYQLLDLPMVAAAIVGAAFVARYRQRTLAVPVALGTGAICFGFAVGNTLLTTAGPFWLTWGYYVTLGGSVLFAFAGLLRVSSPSGMADLDE
jgi:hypothetical protein